MLLDKRLPTRYILSKVKWEIFYIIIIGLLVYYITYKYRNIIPDMSIAIPAFLGTAIFVILSFKLNQSYDRWWEARKVWGSIVNDSRSFILQLQSFTTNRNAIRVIAFRHIAWCFSLGQALRNLNPTENLNKYLSQEDLEKLKKHNNKPLGILKLNSLDILDLRNKGELHLFSHIHINETLRNSSNQMCMAERIKNTVFPVTYRYFLHMFIYLFVITLSISLRGVKSYFEIPLLLVISLAFFLLEKTATHLQDPFSNLPTDTAMTSIATTIVINIKQLLNESEIPAPYLAENFYVL